MLQWCCAGVKAGGQHVYMARVHIGNGYKFSKALSCGSDYVCPLHGLFESAVHTTCATEDNMIDCI